MADSISDAVASAKGALAHAEKTFPSSMAPKASPAKAPVASSTPSPAGPSVGDELRVKAANIKEYTSSVPKMHKGGPIMADGIYALKAGEHVLAPGEADKARKHALMASGMKSLASPGKRAPKGKASMSVEGSNVVDLSGDKAPKIPPAPRSPIPLDDAFHASRTEKT